MAWMVSSEGERGTAPVLDEDLDFLEGRAGAEVSGKGREGLSIFPLGLRGIRARGT